MTLKHLNIYFSLLRKMLWKKRRWKIHVNVKIPLREKVYLKNGKAGGEWSVTRAGKINREEQMRRSDKMRREWKSQCFQNNDGEKFLSAFHDFMKNVWVQGIVEDN